MDRCYVQFEFHGDTLKYHKNICPYSYLLVSLHYQHYICIYISRTILMNKKLWDTT